jgi:SAM-dependent methyltransferase
MDVVMITRDRPELTAQTIRSMRENASDWSRHRLVVVFDGTHPECNAWMDEFARSPEDVPDVVVEVTGKQLGVGGAKNFGAAHLEKQVEIFNKLATPVKPEHAPGSLIMFSDNDLYYLPGWDIQLGRMLLGHPQIVQLGGWGHPYHRPRVHADNDMRPALEIDAVTGCCFVMRWSDWLRYGPFDANAIGPGQSEDFALSQRVRAGGGLCATLDPPVAIHCGLVNSAGEPATGWREMGEMARVQLLAMGEEERRRVVLEIPAEGAPSAAAVDAMYEKRQLLADKLNDAAVEMGFIHTSDGVPILGVDPSSPKSDGAVVWGYRKSGKTFITGESHGPVRLCLGSGQKRFDNSHGWINLDVQSVPPDRVPDIVCDFTRERLPFDDGSVAMIVAEHCIEHMGCGEATPMLRECWRVLASGGSLIVTVPDMRALAGRWLGGELDTQVYLTACYGAYMGGEADRHRWGFIAESLTAYLREALPGEGRVVPFDWREIPGASISRDWWILGMEAIKA